MSEAEAGREAERAGDSTKRLAGLLTRAAALILLVGYSCGQALAALLVRPALGKFVLANRIGGVTRQKLLVITVLVMLVGAAWALSFLYRERKALLAAAERLDAVARRLAPCLLLGFLPLLFHEEAWAKAPLAFLALTALFVFTAYQSVKLALTAPPLPFEARVGSPVADALRRVTEAHPRLLRHLPLVLVIAASAGYVLYFSYYTIEFHRSVYSSFDLGIKNNIFWNTLHGQPFKASVALGPHGHSHFGRHADVLVYALLPIYVLLQRAETILAFQALFMGAAAVPLFFLAERRIGRAAAVCVALSYLLHPALHGGNLFEFHFIGFGLPLLFAAWAAVERRRYLTAGVFAVLTLLTREDVALWITIGGIYLIVSGDDPKVGAIATLVSSVYFVVIKFWVMPRLGGESFADYYEGLPPEGDMTFGGVLSTLIGNPAFTLSTLLKPEKLIFVLQILLPVALLPLSRPIFLLLAVPGFLFTLLSPTYTPLYDIAFHYGAHFLAFVYPGLVLALDFGKRPAFLLPRVVAVICGTLAVSYQFGAVLQQNTAYAGPRPFAFGMDGEAERRNREIAKLFALVPKDAKIACSNLVAPQFSSREDAYDMTQGFFDAEYLVFDLDRLRDDERGPVLERLQNGKFGVVSVNSRFALARAGHDTRLNARVVRRLERNSEAK